MTLNLREMLRSIFRLGWAYLCIRLVNKSLTMTRGSGPQPSSPADGHTHFLPGRWPICWHVDTKHFLDQVSELIRILKFWTGLTNESKASPLIALFLPLHPADADHLASPRRLLPPCRQAKATGTEPEPLYQPAPVAGAGPLLPSLLCIPPTARAEAAAVWGRSRFDFVARYGRAPSCGRKVDLLRRWGGGRVPRRCWSLRRCGCLLPRRQGMPTPVTSSARKLEMFFSYSLMRMQF